MAKLKVIAKTTTATATTDPGVMIYSPTREGNTRIQSQLEGRKHCRADGERQHCRADEKRDYFQMASKTPNESVILFRFSVERKIVYNLKEESSLSILGT